MNQHIVRTNMILIGLLTIIALPVLSTVVKNDEFQSPQSRVLTPHEKKYNEFKNSYYNSVGEKIDKFSKLAILYDTTGIDREFQVELLTAVYIALRDLSDGEDQTVQYIDLGKIPSTTKTSSLVTSAQWIVNNRTSTIVSLLESEVLSEFIQIYDHMKTRWNLKIISPRLVQRPSQLSKTSSIDTLSLQMSDTALTTALLNRVEKIRVKTLVPILDQDNPSQLELLNNFIEAGQHRMEPIQFSLPIFVSPGQKSQALKDILNDESNTEVFSTGILMLATQSSQSVMETANESQNLLQMRWFSPNLMQYEEWALKGSDSASTNFKNNNATFGIYSVHFVGANGWDNPSRRKTLRELYDNNAGASPRILSSILAYDAVWVARNHMKNVLSFPMQGLSGEITFDKDGYRREGIYFGVSAVAELVSPLVSLLQPSTWILEDVLHLVETIEGQYLITDYTVATSSMLTREELLRFAGQTTNSSECQDHSMEIITHDPFNQMPHSYTFNKINLPHHLLIPNHHGYGITFSCLHGQEESETTLKIACTPAGRFNDPVKCFRSHFKSREKRQAPQYSSYRAYPNGYNNYPQYVHGNYLPGNDPMVNSRDDSYNTIYNAPPPQVTPGLYNAPADAGTMAVATMADTTEAATTSAPAAPGPKLPELRQVLKAAKPFVGSCVGAATGCAMCVLVLGRLPLGTLPPACTGPCFVGVFGSCGALLGRAFSETTVICTELFKQGYLDMDTFLADAEFGRQIQYQSPMTLKGYQILATPLVEKMRKSKQLTEIVSKFAIPWAKQMKYMMGYSEEFNWIGYGVNLIGAPICFTVGHLHSWLFSSSTIPTTNLSRDRVILSDSNLSITALLSLTLISLFLHHLFQSSRKKSSFSS